MCIILNLMIYKRFYGFGLNINLTSVTLYFNIFDKNKFFFIVSS